MLATNKSRIEQKEKKWNRAAGLKILTLKQILRRLPIALAQVKSLKKYTRTKSNQFNYKNGYYIYELKK